MKTKKRGFTLIEMLVVITIIGVLSTLILVSVGRIRKNSLDTRRKANLENVRGAISIYYSVKNQFPSNLAWADMITALSNSGYISDNIPIDEDGDGSPDYMVCTCGSNCDVTCSPSVQMKLATRCVISDGEGCNDTSKCLAGWYCLDVK